MTFKLNYKFENVSESFKYFIINSKVINTFTLKRINDQSY
jgi:hypothetical protein